MRQGINALRLHLTGVFGGAFIFLHCLLCRLGVEQGVGNFVDQGFKEALNKSSYGV